MRTETNLSDNYRRDLIRLLSTFSTYFDHKLSFKMITRDNLLAFLEGDSWSKDMKIVPVNFNKEHKAMLGHCKMILERDGGIIAINPYKFDKLITSLRTAVDNDGTLDKEATSYNDIFDAFRLALKFYHFEASSENQVTTITSSG
jgi:hypothetical protein